MAEYSPKDVHCQYRARAPMSLSRAHCPGYGEGDEVPVKCLQIGRPMAIRSQFQAGAIEAGNDRRILRPAVNLRDVRFPDDTSVPSPILRPSQNMSRHDLCL